jgi:hypothetical protein
VNAKGAPLTAVRPVAKKEKKSIGHGGERSIFPLEQISAIYITCSMYIWMRRRKKKKEKQFQHKFFVGLHLDTGQYFALLLFSQNPIFIAQIWIPDLERGNSFSHHQIPDRIIPVLFLIWFLLQLASISRGRLYPIVMLSP